MVALRHPEHSAQSLAEQLRTCRPHIFSRIQADTVLLDLRTVSEADDSALIAAIRLVNISLNWQKMDGRKMGFRHREWIQRMGIFLPPIFLPNNS